ncbi:MAG: 2-C-methyl-D-erythritol 4-phosphate cytidylyltransferase [Candidatus Coatesbacteria bacterium]|nr:2-C-methyl-D-erythritol 4-phosphate cytidylyltransferase [Candidatus Coatesbacteria bacterium]
MNFEHWIVFLSGGIGRRTGKNLPKQFVEIAGKPLFIHSLLCFLEYKPIKKIVLVMPENYMELTEKYIGDYKLSNIVLIKGGKTRQQSSFNALKRINKEKNKENIIVAIHDTARPFTKSEIIEKSFKIALEKGACLVAKGVTDSIYKQSDRVFQQLNRSKLISAETPQTFRFPIIWDAHQKAREQKIENASDDIILVLKAGYDIDVLLHSTNNLKITKAEDFEYTEFIIGKREKDE